MAHIEVDTDDLTLFSNDIKEMSQRIDNLDTMLSSKFIKAKEYDMYSEGFRKMRNYLDSQKARMEGIRSRIEQYQNDMINMEKTFSSRFSSIVVPNFSTDTSGSRPTAQPVQQQPVASAPVSQSAVSNQPSAAATPVADTTTEKANEIVTDTTLETEVETNDSLLINNTEEPVVPPVDVQPGVDDKTVVTTGSKSGFNFDPWVALAGAAGLAGVGGIAAAAAMSAKSSKPKEEKKEEPQQYQPREQQPSYDKNNVFLKIQELQKQNNEVKE